jgi:hypothetical protein
MKTIILSDNNPKIIEIISDQIILKNGDDAIDIMGNVNTDHIVVNDYNLDPDFFDLSSQIAGEILQKFTNYNIKLAIIGDFGKYPSNTLKDFIYECNKVKDHLFVKSAEEAIKIWQEK